MSDYFESVKKRIKSSKHIANYGDSCYCVFKDKKDVEQGLEVSPYCVKYKGYSVPLDDSELEDLHLLVMATYSDNERKNKDDALKELKGE